MFFISFSLLCDAGTKKVWSLVHFFSFPFFLAPHKKEAKKLSGSTYVFGVRSRSSVSLAVVSATITKLTRPRVSSSRLANQHYLSACFLGRCCIGHVSQSPMALGRDRKTRFSSFAQTIDTMHSLRRVAYFASDFLTNPNPSRKF